MLIEYLTNAKLFARDTALVDIGWRGTIHNIIGSLSQDIGKNVPEAFYFGFWDDGRSAYLDRSTGLLADSRRGKNPYEGAAFQLLSLLEACFQADHGMVTALVRDKDDIISPLCVQDGAAREAELLGSAVRQRVQRGVLEYAAWYAESFPIGPRDEKQIRRQAQRRLLRLAYFPDKLFRAVGREMAHIEPTDDKAATPLILSRGKGLRGWFAGLRSPWKGGYFMQTGGYLAAMAYFIFATGFAYLSEAQKFAIRRFLFGKNA
jgi:hypothetical protein